jgi:hypothetical protein
MKKAALMLGPVTVALLLAGCVERRVVYVHDPAPVPPPTAVIATPQAEVAPEVPPPGEVPPAPQVDVVTVAPGPEYVWVGGAWAWHGRWVWAPGRWSMRPHPHAVWYGGHWERRGRRSVWVGGYWR